MSARGSIFVIQPQEEYCCMKWHIGCAGFYYRDWKGIFYPQELVQKKWFKYYASTFNSIELNGTFYKLPKTENLQKWYDDSPADFSFAVKAPRLVTHYKQFKDCKTVLDEFYTIIQQGLHEKLSVVLFQLPPSFSYSPEKLDLIIETLSPQCKNVLEFRHQSWWQKEVYQQLSKHHIIFSGVSHPTLPDEAIINDSIVYYRFHGVPKLYYAEYDKAFLKKIADRFLQQKKLQEAFLYFNNTATLAAINNARWLIEYVSK